MFIKKIQKINLIATYLLLPLVCLLPANYYSIGFIIFILTSLILIKQYEYRQNIAIQIKQLPVFSKIFASMSLIAVIYFIYAKFNLNTNLDIRVLDIYFKYALIIPLYLLTPRLNLRNLLQFWMVSSVIMLFLVMYQYHILQIIRPYGNSHPIIFGNFAISLGLLLFIGKNEYKPWYIALIASLICITTSLYTGTRGGWIVLILFIFITLTDKDFLVSKKIQKKHLIYSIILFFILFALLLNTKLVQSRINASIQEALLIYQGNLSTSFGLRLSLWKHSIIYLINNPWGGGVDSFYQQIFLTQRSLGGLPEEAQYAELNHPHNDILFFATQFGIIGITWYAALHYSLWKFFTNLNNSIIAKMGVYFMYSYMLFSITQSMFAHNRSNIFFMLVLIQLYKCLGTKNNHE